MVSADRLAVPLADGQSVSVRAWRPARASRRAVIGLHGSVSHAGWFEGLAQRTSAEGVAFFAADRRGSGEHRQLPGAQDPELWVSDIRGVVEAVAKEFSDVTLLGWCWGALPGTVAAAQENRLSRIIYAAPSFCPSSQVSERARSGLASQAEELPLPYDPVRDFSDSGDVQRWIDADPLLKRSRARSHSASSGRLRTAALQALPNLAPPVFCVLAKDDKIVDNAATRLLLRGRPVVEMAGGHALVLEDPVGLASRILRWIEGGK